MECHICKKTESEFRKKFQEILTVLETEKANLNGLLQNVREKFSQENGFTEDSKGQLKNLDEKYLELKFHAYLESQKIFDELDKNLVILKNYYNKYKPEIIEIIDERGYGYSKSYKEITMNDILEQYMLEPIDERYESIKEEIEKKIANINPHIEKIKKTTSFFFEIDINPEQLVPNNHYSTSYRNLNPNIFSFILPNKVYLCPHCAALFNAASTASFALKLRMDDDDD